MTSLKDLKDQLEEVPCHFVWDLEKKSMKQFNSLMNSINDFIDDFPEMKIEGLLFKSYLFFSNFKGNLNKEKFEATKCLDEIRTILNENGREECLKDGYLSIVIALEAWLESRNKTKLKANIEKLRELCLKYKIGSNEHNMFQGSIHATRGFALSRVGMFRYSESIEQLEKAVKMCPRMKNWLFFLGKIIWRKAKASDPRNIFNETRMSPAETIFSNVLQIDEKHSYAMVRMADIKRRKEEFEHAERLLENVIQIDGRQKILGEVSQVYRKMKKYTKAMEHLQTAISRTESCTSFIYHQLYLVYRDMKQTPPNDYLQWAIDANPSNMAAQCDRAREFIAKQEYDEAQNCYDNILDNNENDPEIFIETNYFHGKFLENIKRFEDSIEKFQLVVDKALEECKLNDKQPFTFFEEINWMVIIAAKGIRRYHKRQGTYRGPLLKLVELEKKLGNRKEAITYNQLLLNLQTPIDAELRFTVLADIASMKTENGPPFDDVDSIIDEMEQMSLYSPDPNVLYNIKSTLAIEKGKLALGEGREVYALNLFRDAVKLGNITGATLLLHELQKMNKESSDFYTYCAEISVCLDKSQEDKKETLKKKLNELLCADPSDKVGIALSDVRKSQFNMERSIVKESGQSGCSLGQPSFNAASTVIHKCRIILNQTMMMFKGRHYGHVDKSCDYFNVRNCSSVNIEDEVKKD